MKKHIFFAMMLAAAMGLTACGNDDVADQYADVGAAIGSDASKPADDTIQNELAEENAATGQDIAQEEGDGTLSEGAVGSYWIDEDLPVSMRTEQSAYLPDVDVIKATIVNNTDETFTFPADQFTLCRMQNGEAIPLPYKEGGDYFFALAGFINPHETGTATFNLANHYDLPLEEGVYSIELCTLSDGTMLTAGFEISANADAVINPADYVTMYAQQERYPADTTEIQITIVNDGETDFEFVSDAFGLEHYMDGAVSYTPIIIPDDAPVSAGVLPPHLDTAWTVRFADYGSETLEPGEYAVCLNGIEAKFVIEE